MSEEPCTRPADGTPPWFYTGKPLINNLPHLWGSRVLSQDCPAQQDPAGSQLLLLCPGKTMRFEEAK